MRCSCLGFQISSSLLSEKCTNNTLLSTRTHPLSIFNEGQSHFQKPGHSNRLIVALYLTKDLAACSACYLQCCSGYLPG